MKLYYSPPSPFARKVIVAAHELGLADQIVLEQVAVTPVSQNDLVAASNPLAKVPTLVLEDGQALFDSRVIVDYLDSLSERSLAPRDGAQRWRVLTELAQADGLLDAALLARYELMRRPEPLRGDAWTDGQMSKVRRALDAFETSARRAGDDLGIADIGVACGLGYLDFRFPDEGWREGRPRLAAFYAQISRRPSWLATDPNG
jgi:glutathione S-transferase